MMVRVYYHTSFFRYNPTFTQSTDTARTHHLYDPKYVIRLRSRMTLISHIISLSLKVKWFLGVEVLEQHTRLRL